MEFNNDTLHNAVRIYVDEEGERLYGHINTWIVSKVTYICKYICKFL
jgi:hypothetical protein